MKKNAINLVACLATAALLVACGHLAKPPKGVECTPDKNGAITIKYGVVNNKTTFEVKEKIKVEGNSGLIFKLDPKNYKCNQDPKNCFADKTVTLVGKTTDDGKNAWFTAISGSYNDTASDDHKIGICAPNPDRTTEYEYLITIEDFGTLDPRVDVEPQ